jgi:hypothetical protein
MTLSGIFVAFLMIALASQLNNVSSLRQIVTRNVTAIQLSQGIIMEIIEEQSCSAALIRLTCRSFNSFVFVLEALYQPNCTDACVYNRDSWCKYRSFFEMVRNLQHRRNFLRGSYEHERVSLDFRDTINSRYPAVFFSSVYIIILNTSFRIYNLFHINACLPCSDKKIKYFFL